MNDFLPSQGEKFTLISSLFTDDEGHKGGLSGTQATQAPLPNESGMGNSPSHRVSKAREAGL